MDKKYISKVVNGEDTLYIKDAEARESMVSSISYDTTNKKLIKTINGVNSDIVTVSTIKSDLNLSKSDVGLSNVTNDAQVKRSEMGANSGVATLDAAGKVPSSQLPSYVDDVIEYANKASFPSTGETGKIYVDKATNEVYRWSGSQYIAIADSQVQANWSTTDTTAKSYIQNKPTNVSSFTNDAGYLTQHQDISGKANIADLATVATSGSYNDLSNKPTIPTVPTNVSAFTNDAGYLTQHQSLADYVTQEEFEEAMAENAQDISYGISWTSTSATPKRIGNMSMHRSLPIQSKMRRCMVQDNGNVYGYIDPADYTKYTDGTEVDYTGAHGQYCVEIPEYWYEGTRISTDSGYTYGISLYAMPVTGTKHSPKYYVSAVEATTNDTDSSESTKKLFSICMANVVYDNDGNVNASDVTLLTDSEKYIGGNRNTSYTGVKSLHGRPATSFTRANFRTRAAARGTGWSQQYWDAYMAWVRLYVVEYCSFNSQAPYNANKTSNGYMQGGLGAGVSEVGSSAWSNFNGYNPFVPCGVTKRLGNATGVVDYKFAAGEFQESALTVHVPAYRGIENPFGHIWKWTDGLNAYCDGETHKTSIYTCNNPANFADNTSDNYVLRTSDMYQGTEGWIKSWLVDENADFIPLTTGGSGSSYLCDYSWANNTGWRVLYSGGSAHHGAACGLFYFGVDDDSSSAYAHFGGRLYYTPQN